MNFGKSLSEFRRDVKISQRELASILGLNFTYISKIENGKRNPPDRDVVLEIASALNLNETQTDELLVSANYQPQTLFDLGFDSNDISLKKHIGVLKDIKNKAPLTSYIKAKEEIADYLDLMRTKYTGKIDEKLAKNTLLADYLYSKVRRGGLRALYKEVSRPLGGALVIVDGKLLLHQIGISQVKGWWHIPCGFVNPKKGDKSAKDIAVRLVKRYLGDVELEVVKELTAASENLENLDSSDYSIKLGLFPFIVQVYEVKVKDKNKIKLAKRSGLFKVSKIPSIGGDIHPMLSQIVKLYFKDNKVAKSLQKRGEESIVKVLAKKDHYEKAKEFEIERIRRKKVR